MSGSGQSYERPATKRDIIVLIGLWCALIATLFGIGWLIGWLFGE